MSVIDDYLQALSEPNRLELERIRKLVLEMAPDAEEVTTYGLPGFKYKKKYLVAFAAFKDHLGLFPTPGPIAALQDKLHGYKLSKGTIQFTLDNPLPESLLREIIQHRIHTIENE